MRPPVIGRLDISRRSAPAHIAATFVALAVACVAIAQMTAAGSRAAQSVAPCVGASGPGLPPPTNLTFGRDGFHAAWYGQSGYRTLCPGERSTVTVAIYNTGSRGWVAGRMGEAAYLGTWYLFPGQDRPSIVGGDGQRDSPNTGWPRYDRPAVQPAPYVGPGQVAWFQFTIQAPVTPGVYLLYLRPLIEGAQWMEDYGIYQVITVLDPTGAIREECLAPISPWSYRFCGEGRIFAPPPEFCAYFACVQTFWSEQGYVVQCQDLLFSWSGGSGQVCVQHGGWLRDLLTNPTPPPAPTPTPAAASPGRGP